MGSAEEADDHAEERRPTVQGHTGGNPEPAVTFAPEPPEVPVDPVEAALGDAVAKAAVAGQWGAVEALTAELKARREIRANVVSLDSERRRRER